jgi:hypothetical protein
MLCQSVPPFFPAITSVTQFNIQAATDQVPVASFFMAVAALSQGGMPWQLSLLTLLHYHLDISL